jgi:hypothetical protein
MTEHLPWTSALALGDSEIDVSVQVILWSDDKNDDQFLLIVLQAGEIMVMSM